MSYLPLILIIAVATWLARAGGFHLARRSLPPAIDGFLGWVPVAAFAALTAPGLVDGPGPAFARVGGAIAASIIVSRSLPYWAALAAGMGVFWLLSAIGQA